MIIASRSTSPRGAALACAAVLGLAGFVGGCADKGFTPPHRAFSPVISLQINTTASQVAGFGPHWIVVAAGFNGDSSNGNGNGNGNGSGNGNGDNGLLAQKFVPFTTGAQQITLAVDISKCLAYFAQRGRSSCPLLVGAALVADTLRGVGADSSGGDVFGDAFDEFITGPFDVAPGHTPTIPAFDLSATRFGVIRWDGDDALRLGGSSAPEFGSGAIAGAASGTGAPVLFVPTQGFDIPNAQPNQPAPGPYPQLAILENGAWRRVTATSVSSSGQGFANPFTAVTALGPTEAYLANSTGLYKYDGTGITRVTTVNDSIFAVASVNVSGAGGSAKLVIAGTNGGAWIGNTQTWQRYSIPTAQHIDGVCITGANEAFASSFAGGVWRFNGTTWTSAPPPTTGQIYGLQCPGPGKAYVQVLGGPIFVWGGSAWFSMPTTGLTGRSLAIGAVSPTEVYAVGDSGTTDRAFYKFDGSSWQEVGRTRFVQPSAATALRMWADPRGGAAYYGSSFGRVEKVTPSGVSVLAYQPALRDIAMTSSTSAFAVGWNLFLARWDGAKWTVDAPPAGTPTVRILQGVWTDGPSNAWAVGGANTILRYTGTAWSVLSDISHPIGGSDSYNAVWGSGSDVWIAGTSTILHCRTGSPCSTESSGGSGALYGIWGSSANNVYAVGAGGRIVRYNGTSWSSVASPTTRTLVRVSGSAPNDIWAVGDSVLLRFDGTQWTNYPMTGDLYHLMSHAPSQLQGEFQIGLWVRGPKEAYLGGEFGTIARWDGSGWTEMTFRSYRRRILGIAGAPGGCGLLVTDTQVESPSPALWRGVGPTGCFSTPMVAPTSWP